MRENETLKQKLFTVCFNYCDRISEETKHQRCYLWTPHLSTTVTALSIKCMGMSPRLIYRMFRGI